MRSIEIPESLQGRHLFANNNAKTLRRPIGLVAIINADPGLNPSPRKIGVGRGPRVVLGYDYVALRALLWHAFPVDMFNDHAHV
jgi:hypothetical protein